MVGDLIHNARTSHSLFLTTISASQRASDRLIGHLLNPLHEARKFFELSPLVYHVLLHAARCLFDLRFSKSRVRRRRKAPNLRASNGCSPSLDLVFRLVGPTGARRLNSPDRTRRDELPSNLTNAGSSSLMSQAWESGGMRPSSVAKSLSQIPSRGFNT